jgi:Ran GTPase-activating protein (RanGAP) involved in mRNA processing and transport
MQRVFSAAKLKSLVISGNALDAAFCHQTAHGLAAATQLTSLNLSDNSIGPKGCIALVSELPNAAISPVPPEAACQLRALDLSGCGIGDAGFVALCTAIARGVQLRRLQVGRAGLSAAGVAEGVQQLRSMKDCSIETLDVSGSHDCIDASSVACLGKPSGIILQSTIATTTLHNSTGNVLYV